METTKEIVLGEGRKVVRCGGEEIIFDEGGNYITVFFFSPSEKWT